MDYYIINDGFNWADEIDCEGFIILTQKHVDHYRKILSKSEEDAAEVNEDYEDLEDEDDEDDFDYEDDDEETIELWCGSNESIEVDSETIEAIEEDLKNPTKITEQEYKTLKKLLDLRENKKSEDYLTSYGNSLTELYIRQRL